MSDQQSFPTGVGPTDPRTETTTPDRARDAEPRLARNLAISWASQLVFAIAGFIMPRSTDAHLGQAAVGVWDFGWGIVGQFGLAQLGINTSVDRFVARYRSQGDVAGFRRMTSSVLLVQVLVALFLMGLSVVLSYFVPSLIKTELASEAQAARWVVLLLGASLSIKIGCATFDGVLSGCFRWDLHNLVESSSYALIVAGMLSAQVMGYGLRSMAAVYLTGTVLAEIVRIAVAHRVCPELRIRPRYVKLSESRAMFAFGGKVFVMALSGRLLYQMNAIQIGATLGPALLALYMRPMSLVHLVSTFLGKFSNMLTPVTSRLEAAGRSHEVNRLLLDSTRSSAFLTIPPVAFLCIMGGPLIGLWMGERYAAGGALLLAVLALGHLPSFVHRVLGNVLIGVNAHGTYAWGAMAAAVTALVLCAIFIGPLGLGLTGAALAVGIPLTLAYGVFLPIRGCRILGVPFGDYVVQAWKRPLVINAPFVLVLALLRLTLPPLPALLLGGAIGGPLLAGLYWRFVLPESLKGRLLRRLRAAVGS